MRLRNKRRLGNSRSICPWEKNGVSPSRRRRSVSQAYRLAGFESINHPAAGTRFFPAFPPHSRRSVRIREQHFPPLTKTTYGAYSHATMKAPILQSPILKIYVNICYEKTYPQFPIFPCLVLAGRTLLLGCVGSV